MDSAGLSNALYLLLLETLQRSTNCLPKTGTQCETYQMPLLNLFSLSSCLFFSFIFLWFSLALFLLFLCLVSVLFVCVFVCVCVSFRLFGFYYFSVKFMTRLPPVFFIVWPCHVLHSARACVSCFSDPTRSRLLSLSHILPLHLSLSLSIVCLFV